MSTFKFDCPDRLAQKFWLACLKQGATPGFRLRELMISDVQAVDPGFCFDPEKRASTPSEPCVSQKVEEGG